MPAHTSEPQQYHAQKGTQALPHHGSNTTTLNVAPRAKVSAQTLFRQ